MFYSVSQCTPNSNVTVEFTSTQRQELDIAANVTILVNGGVESSRPVQLNLGDHVAATVTTPAGYLGYRIIPYTLGDTENGFAVVNRNLYQPTVIPRESRKRWFNYDPTEFRISFYGDLVSERYLLGYGRGIIDIEQLHVVLDNMDNAVCFYSTQQEMISRVRLPAGPIDYCKRNYTNLEPYTYELIVLCNDGRLYRIRYDNRYTSSDSFEPTVTPIFFLDDLYYLQDLPNGGSFMDLARYNYLKRLYPYITALDINGGSVWIAGYENVSRLSTAFQLQSTVTLTGEDVVDLACIGSDVIAVTRGHEVYYITAGGTSTLLYTGSALGSPCSIDGASRVAVPDPNNRRILIFDSNSPSYAVWDTVDFAPAYCFDYNDSLWVTGYDTNRVVHFVGDDRPEYYEFDSLVTLVSVIGLSILATHSLEEFTTLDRTGIEKIIPITVPRGHGPVSHIGMEPVTVTMLGQQDIVPKPGPRITCWSNGVANGPLSTGSYFGVSFRAQRSGSARSCFVIGDRAYDYDITVQSSSDLTDYYRAGVSSVNYLTPIFGIIEPPDYGDNNLGITLGLDLGFQLNYYGNIYSNINVGTDGYIKFESNTSYAAVTAFNQLGIDALYPEPIDLYQGLPIDNVDPLNITTGRLDTNEIPRIYYRPQQLGEFTGFRLRWVGTSWASKPLGVTLPTVTGTQNWLDIPLFSTNDVDIGDYISGNGIVISTTVTNKYAYSASAVAYRSGAGYVLLSLPDTTIPKYSNIAISGLVIGFANGYNYTQSLGNVVLAFSGNTVIVDGIIATNVTVDDVFVTATGSRVLGACSIVTSTESVSTAAAANNTTAIQVSQPDQVKFLLGQQVRGPDIVGVATVTGNSTVPVTYTLTSSANIAVEDSDSITFTLTASGTTLTNGSNIAYTIAGTNITSSDFGLASLTGNVAVSAGAASLTLSPVADLDIEGIEEFSVTMQPELLVTVSTTANIANVNVAVSVGSGASSTVLARTEYYVNVSTPQTVPAANTLVLEQTAITFNSAVAAFAGAFTYQRNQLYVQSGPSLAVTTPTNLSLTGNFATVSNPQTILASTAVLFKANVPAPSLAYEVGFYSGRGFQYIEYYYDNAHHNALTTVGIGAEDPAEISANTTASAGTSVLFGSYAYDGRWRLLGSGSFTQINQGFYPRTVDIVRSRPYNDTEARFEFILTQRIPTFSNVYASLNYGYLERNYRQYTGLSKLATDDHFVVTIPFGSGQSPAAPILSIGDYQIAIPTVPDSRLSTFFANTVLVDSVAKEVLITSNISVPASGTYYIPEYYKTINNESGSELEFTRTRAGNVTVLTAGTYNEFQAGDVITIGRHLSSRRTYDTRTVSIVGPWTLSATLRTAGNTVFDQLNYGTVNQPFVRYQEYQQSGNELTAYNPYKTGNLVLTSNGQNITSSLYVDTPGVDLLVNGIRRGNYATGVATGANLALDWTVQTYFESNVIVYQVYLDQHDSSNIFVPMAQWTINNKSVNGTGLDHVVGTVQNLVADVVETAATSTEQIQPQRIANDAVYIVSGAVSSDVFANDASFVEIPGVTPETSPGNGTYFLSNAVTAEHGPSVRSELPGNIVAETSPGDSTYFLSNAVSGTGQTAIGDILAQIAEDIMAFDTTYILSGQYSSNITAESQITLISEPSSTGNLMGAITEFSGNHAAGIPAVFSEQATFRYLDNIISASQFNTGTDVDRMSDHTELISTTDSDYLPSQTETVQDHQPALEINSELEAVDLSAELVINIELEAAGLIANLLESVEPLLNSVTANFITQPESESVGTTSQLEPTVTELNSNVASQLITTATASAVEFDVDHVQTQEITQTIGPDYVSVTNLIGLDFAAELAQYNQIMPTMTPLLYQENRIPIAFDAQAYQPIARFVNVTPVREYSQPRPVLIPFELDQESHWEMTDLSLGTVNTLWRTYADNGRWGDMGLNRGPTGYRGPFLPYDANTGTTLLTTVSYATINITDYDGNGNVVSNSNQWVYTNGIVYFYNSLRDTFTRANANVITVTTDTITDGNVNAAIETWGGTVYGAGGYTNSVAAASMAARYVSATAFQIAGTDIWNYRIHFNNQVYCTQRRGTTFPVTWLIRGG